MLVIFIIRFEYVTNKKGILPVSSRLFEHPFPSLILSNHAAFGTAFDVFVSSTRTGSLCRHTFGSPHNMLCFLPVLSTPEVT